MIIICRMPSFYFSCRVFFSLKTWRGTKCQGKNFWEDLHSRLQVSQLHPSSWSPSSRRFSTDAKDDFGDDDAGDDDGDWLAWFPSPQRSYRTVPPTAPPASRPSWLRSRPSSEHSPSSTVAPQESPTANVLMKST